MPYRADLPDAERGGDGGNRVLHRVDVDITNGFALTDHVERGSMHREQTFGCIGLYIPSSAFVDGWTIVLSHACDNSSQTVRLKRTGEWVRLVCDAVRSETTLNILSVGRCDVRAEDRIPRDFFFLNPPLEPER